MKQLFLFALLAVSAFAQIINPSGGGGGSVAVNGATVTSPNFQNSDTAFHNLNGNFWTTSSSNITSQQYNYPPWCVMWGDSISTLGGAQSGGTNLPTGSGGYTGLLFSNECSSVPLNPAQSGDMSADLNLKVYSHSDSVYLFPTQWSNNRPAIHTIMIGTNDANNKANSTYQTGVYRPAMYGVLTHLAIPRVNKLYATDATCTATGTWAADNQFFTGMGKKSNTNGDKVVCTGIVTTAASPFIYFGYGVVDANLGVAGVKVDGAACTDTVTASATINHFDPATIATTNGATKAVNGGRCSAAAGTHTFEIDVTSATNASNVVYFEWVGSMPSVTSASSALTRILQAGVLKQRTDTNAPWPENYNTEISTITSTLAGDKLPIQFVDVSGMPTSAAYYADGLHPSDTGHAYIHDQFSQYMQGFSGNRFSVIKLGGGDATNQWLEPVICITNNQGEFAFGTCPTSTGSFGDETKNLNANNFNAINGLNLYQSSGGNRTNLIGTLASGGLQVASNICFGISNSTSSLGTIDTQLCRNAANIFSFDTTAASNGLGSWISGGTNRANGNRVTLTADWTCGTGGTVSSCVAATIIGSGGGNPMTFTLPLVAQSWHLNCNGVAGQATAATANSWNILTATNGATNLEANYSMNTAATAMTGGAVTGQSSTTTTVVIAPTWTLGGTATKMPFTVEAEIEGASASGTVLSFQLVAPTVGDLVTIYRGTTCELTASKQ